MFNELVKRVKRSQLIIMAILLVIGVVCLIPTKFNIIKLINGPEKVNLVKNDIKDYKNEYIEVNIYHPLEMYEEDYLEDTDTKQTRTTHYGYIIMDADETYTDYTLYGLIVPKEYKDTIYDLAEDSYTFLGSEDLLPTYKPFVAQGTVIKMDATELGFYNESLEYLGLETVSEAYFIAHEKLPGNMDTTFVIVLTVISGVCILGAIVMLIIALSNSGIKSIEKYLAKNSTKTIEQFDAEFQGAKCFGKNIWVSKDHIFTPGAFSVKIIDLNDIVWAYYYKKTGKNPQSYVRMYNSKKRMLYVNASESVAFEILEYLDQITTHIVLGYNKELQQTFNKNFSEFLNIKFNAPKSDIDDLF